MATTLDGAALDRPSRPRGRSEDAGPVGASYPRQRSASWDPVSPGPRTTQGLLSPSVTAEGGANHRGAHPVTALNHCFPGPDRNQPWLPN